MKAWESERKRQKEAERRDAVAGGMALLGLTFMFVASVALIRGICYETSAMFTVGALLLEAGLFVDKIYKIKYGRKR